MRRSLCQILRESPALASSSEIRSAYGATKELFSKDAISPVPHLINMALTYHEARTHVRCDVIFQGVINKEHMGNGTF